MNYNPDMSAADKEAESLLLVVPTGNSEHPLMVELGRWDENTEEWTGEWRHTDEHEESDPIAWAAIPEIDPGLYPKTEAHTDEHELPGAAA